LRIWGKRKRRSRFGCCCWPVDVLLQPIQLCWPKTCVVAEDLLWPNAHGRGGGGRGGEAFKMTAGHWRTSPTRNK
jgi:hypothetical protein